MPLVSSSVSLANRRGLQKSCGSQPYRHVRATVRGYWRDFAGSNLARAIPIHPPKLHIRHSRHGSRL